MFRGSFGIYYSQIVDNSEANYALTGPTGVFNYVATPGQVGFPTSIAAAPLPAFPAGAQAPLRSLYVRPGNSSYLNQFFPTNTLIGYQNGLYNPYSEQWTFGVERQIAPKWVLAVDYVGSHTVKINRPLDVDPPSPLHSHGAEPDPHGAGRQLHAAVLDRVVRGRIMRPATRPRRRIRSLLTR